MLNKTAMNAVHRKLGGQMTDFGGWEMPLWYPTGGVKEHLYVIEKSGVFDIGHMAVVRLKGEDAKALLQLCLTRNIEKLAAGNCAYSVILNDEGHVIDDTIVYNMGGDEYVLISNAGMGSVVAEHLTSRNTFKNVTVRDDAGNFGKVDLQGPSSVSIMRKLLSKGKGSIDGLKYFKFLGDYAKKDSAAQLPGDIPVLLSRTGYTGEVGFEIWSPFDRILEIWNMILETGGDDVIPCGLAARDSLRTGAILPLSHQDIGHWPFVNTPWSFALPLDKDGKLTKSFIGSKLYDNPPSQYTLPFCGFDPRKVETDSAAVLLNGENIGAVPTCVIDMAIGRADGKVYSVASPDKPKDFRARGLSCGFVRVDKNLAPGTKIALKDARRTVEVEIVSDIRPARTARIAI
ncbi:aminomethyltransferase [Synergistales bacterium]|nr:aminomethyltransferase [Synergistales bacterium]